MYGNSVRENWETPEVPALLAGRSAKAMRRNADMNASGEPDGCVVPAKGPNKGGSIAPAEDLEGRRPTKENAEPTTSSRTQSRNGEWRGLRGVRQVARRHKAVRFTALLHHVTAELLRTSFLALKRKAIPGVDGMTWKEYETDPDTRLVDLHERVHRGTYRAQPSKRAYIPKADGRLRPLGIAALEDKIVQHAVVRVRTFWDSPTDFARSADVVTLLG
jgi:hypothetical protein